MGCLVLVLRLHFGLCSYSTKIIFYANAAAPLKAFSKSARKLFIDDAMTPANLSTKPHSLAIQREKVPNPRHNPKKNMISLHRPPLRDAAPPKGVSKAARKLLKDDDGKPVDNA